MHSFPYPQQALYQYPPTPPEDLMPGFAKQNMAYQYQTQRYQNHMGMHQNERRMEFHPSQYGHAMMNQMVPQQMYPNTTYLGAPSITATAMPGNNYYKQMPAPIHPPLPPMRVYDNMTLAPHMDHSRPMGNQIASRPQESKEERPVGGVSAKLDYDMDTMTDFVAETAHSMYVFIRSMMIAMLTKTRITPNRPTPVNFRKWVHQVLSATRLPSATILLAFEYLASYIKITQHARRETSETDLYHMLTTALILGSKFLDDNTFINRSWADVSGIEVATLNGLERDWLVQFGFSLHRDPTRPDGFDSFLARWKQYEGALTVRNSPRTAISQSNQQLYSPITRPGFGQPSPPPVYTTKQPHAPFHQPQQFGRYDPFVPATSSATTSPPSAPHSGPTTPEYYGPQANWTVLPGGFGFARLPPPAYASSQQGMQQASPPMQQGNGFGFSGPVYASGHGPECFCTACNRRYMMAPDFGVPQPVVG
jgi:hypothetical protein